MYVWYRCQGNLLISINVHTHTEHRFREFNHLRENMDAIVEAYEIVLRKKSYWLHKSEHILLKAEKN
jgi:hypothetical protein